MPVPAATTASLLLRGLVLGLALSLRGKALAPNGYRAVKPRDLALAAVGDHAAVLSALRVLWRIGPEEYVKRELRALKDTSHD